MGKSLNNYLSTFFGLIVAVLMAWTTIDWDNFEFSKNNIFKLLLSGAVAAGGYFTSINGKQKSESTPFKDRPE